MPHFEPAPDTVTIEIFDRSRDTNGNPTAHYLAMWSNGKTGADYDGGTLRSKRREQVGYGDKNSAAVLYALGQRFPRTVWIVSPDGISENRSGTTATFTAVRDYDAEPVPVIFRAEKSGEFKGQVTAVFPTLPGTNDPWTCTIYAHVGQHGTGSRDWYDTTRPALPSEYAALQKELESAPFNYNLQLRKVWLPAFDDMRRAALA